MNSKYGIHGDQYDDSATPENPNAKLRINKGVPKDYNRYLKCLENELQCALPKLRKLIEERNEMIEALMDVRHSIEDAKTNNGSVILGDHCEKKVIQALKNTGKL